MKRLVIILAGYEAEVGDRFRIPLGISIEPVFGSAIPISFLIHSGIQYIL